MLAILSRNAITVLLLCVAVPASATSGSFAEGIAPEAGIAGFERMHDGIGGLERGSRDPIDWMREHGLDRDDFSYPGSVVPEPSSAPLLVAGIALVGVLARRRLGR
jgi:hypothetical protein